MRSIKEIVIHVSATPPGMSVGVVEIRKMHLARGFHDIGYHDVIRRDGRVEKGRPIEKVGAHVKGHNAYSIGICLEGGVNKWNEPEFNFTRAQMDTLNRMLDSYKIEFPDAVVKGHRDFPNVNKACPCFDVISYTS